MLQQCHASLAILGQPECVHLGWSAGKEPMNGLPTKPVIN